MPDEEDGNRESPFHESGEETDDLDNIPSVELDPREGREIANDEEKDYLREKKRERNACVRKNARTRSMRDRTWRKCKRPVQR